MNSTTLTWFCVHVLEFGPNPSFYYMHFICGMILRPDGAFDTSTVSGHYCRFLFSAKVVELWISILCLWKHQGWLSVLYLLSHFVNSLGIPDTKHPCIKVWHIFTSVKFYFFIFLKVKFGVAPVQLPPSPCNVETMKRMLHFYGWHFLMTTLQSYTTNTKTVHRL